MATKRERLDEAAERRMAGAYNDGVSIDNLSKRFHVSRDTIVKVCKKYGCVMRPNGYRSM